MTNKEQERKVDSKIQTIEPMDLGSSQGMVCDFETGVCGSINEEKEEKK
ncbi:hypothetical protein LNK15_07760 [Jeotgalicoccus huakuii]|nr:hypothetical protein [Jeotgalicoccus marinus]MCK1976947.1 hypothetical protein [Jeotgalicoccus huakuii]